MAKTFYIETYGCQMNVADSEVVAAILKARGFEHVKDKNEADIILVNTCSVRENAEQRVRGRVLREFHALPTEERARAMKDRDYLWCLANTLMDREEALGRLCPACRIRTLEERCARCGRPAAEWGESDSNTSFDLERFEQLKGGGA